MSDEKKYTIVLKQKRIIVTKEVYETYHQSREAERYQQKCIRGLEYSLERFQAEGVNAEYEIARYAPSIEEQLIKQEVLGVLFKAIGLLTTEERFLIDKLFFKQQKEAEVARELAITQQAINKRKQKILAKLKRILEI